MNAPRPADIEVPLAPDEIAAKLTECRNAVRRPDGRMFTLDEIAQAVHARVPDLKGPTRQAISSWLTGQPRKREDIKALRPNIRQLKALAIIFGKPAGYFLADTHEDLVHAQEELFDVLADLQLAPRMARSFIDHGWARDKDDPEGPGTPPTADATTLRTLADILRSATREHGDPTHWSA